MVHCAVVAAIATQQKKNHTGAFKYVRMRRRGRLCRRVSFFFFRLAAGMAHRFISSPRSLGEGD